jgi:hypothetical protein
MSRADRNPWLAKMSETMKIRVITKLPNSEQSYKGKVKTHNYINRQNQSIPTMITIQRITIMIARH